MTRRSLLILGIVCALALAFGPSGVGAADTKAPSAGHGEAAAAKLEAAAPKAERGGGHEESGGLINLDKSLIIQIVNFLILLFILQRLLYRPLLAKMEERTSAIKKSLEEAQAARAEAARQQEENAARLRQVHQEAAAIREQALKDAAEEQKRLVDAARGEAQRLVDSARAQMDADVRRAREELRREVGDIATTVAETLIRKSLRDEDHRRVVAEAMARLGN